MDFSIDPETDEFRAQVRKMAEGNFAAKAAYWDQHEEFPEENRLKLAELGYLGLSIPSEYGGSDGSFLQAIIGVEEIARVCPNTAVVAQLYMNNVPVHIASLGTEEQKQRWLPKLATGEYFANISISEPHAGSAMTDMTTSATVQGDQVILNGAKCYFTAGHRVTHALIVCRFGKSSGANGIGAVMVERGTRGFETGKPHSKMGVRGMGEADVFLDDCRVPLENVLVMGTPDSTASFKRLFGSFGVERVGTAGMSIGVATAAMEFAKNFTLERKQFGKALCEFQGIQWKIADMATQIHAARLMAYRAATHTNEWRKPNRYEATMAKLYANEMVQRVANDAMQLCGHYGYTTEAPVERLYRDGRNWALAAGSVEILRNTIAELEYGRKFDQRAS
jgi:butyryl-CoA dehydrogenase